MSAHHALHPQYDMDRLYLSGQADRKRLLQIKLAVEEEKRALNDYIKNSSEHAVKAVCDEELLNVNESECE